MKESRISRKKTGFGEPQNNGEAKRFSPPIKPASDSKSRRKTGFGEAQNNGVAKRFGG